MFVELPEAGAQVSAGGSFGNVESVKATSDVNSPISGEVVEVNSKLSEAPGLVRRRRPTRRITRQLDRQINSSLSI